MEIMSKLHVWIGISNVDNNTFNEYFKIDYSDPDRDIDDPKYKICGFCKDINEKVYDEDWIGVYWQDELTDVDEFIEELSVDDETMVEIRNICIQKGLIKVNTMFFYFDSEIEITDVNKLYNGLHYIGLFDTDF